MALDRSETSFKGPRSFLNEFGRFFVRKVVIGHFDRTLKIAIFLKNVLSMRKSKKRAFFIKNSDFTPLANRKRKSKKWNRKSTAKNRKFTNRNRKSKKKSESGSHSASFAKEDFTVAQN